MDAVLLMWIVLGILFGFIAGVIIGLMVKTPEIAKSTMISTGIGYAGAAVLVFVGIAVFNLFIPVPMAFITGIVNYYLFLVIFWAVESFTMWIMVN